MIAPPLAELLRHVTEMPAAFRGEANVRAVVADLIETLSRAAPPETTLAAFVPAGPTAAENNRLRWVLAGCHLLWHPSFRTRGVARESIERLLVQDLATLAGIVPVDELDRDEERREELVRRALRALAVTLPGESTNEAEDRFRQVDSVERRRVLIAAAEREKRAREVREAMARKAAQEAAAKVSRE
jgi:hypothetical protein